MKHHLQLLCMLLLVSWNTIGQTAIAPATGDGTSGNPYQISNWQNLYWISLNPTEWNKHYIQTIDIDFADATPSINTWDGNKGWTPIGNNTIPFTGTYIGSNYSISGIYINRSVNSNMGLFGKSSRAALSGIMVMEANVTSTGDFIGILIGDATYGTQIVNCQTTGSVTGVGRVGGLCGRIGTRESTTNPEGLISECSSSATVNGISFTGGLVGWVSDRCAVAESFATGNVTGREEVGGLIGSLLYNTEARNVFATGTVTQKEGTRVGTGGLIGKMNQSKLLKGYSTGELIPFNNDYSLMGGLIGVAVTGGPFAVDNSFWDETSSKMTSSAAGTSKTTAEMQTQATFTNWDFTNIWAISPAANNGYPNLDGKSAITWNGNTDSDWATELNWSTGSLPAASDDVIIPAVVNAPIIGSGTTASCHHLVIESGGELTIDGTLDNSGTVTVNSDALASGSLILNGTLNGNVTYNRYLVNDRWHLVSSPVSGQTFNSTFFADNSIDHNPGSTAFALIDYDTENNQWNAYPSADASGTFTSAKGFLVARYVDSSVGGTVGFTGPVNTGDVSFTPSTAGYRWNAVGNPFTSAIGINSNAGTTNFIDENSSNLSESFAAIYYWDDTDGGIGNYIEINQSSSAFYAAPGQGFFVQAASGATAINFPVNLRTHQGSVTLKSGQAEWPQLEITAKSGDVRSVATIKFVDGSTPGLDVGYDAGKFKSNPRINIFTKLVDDNGVDFGLQCLPPTHIESLAIPVGLDVKSAGEISFSINYSSLPGNLIPVLEDRLLNIKTPFETVNNNYKTTVSESESDYGRFYVSFSSTTDLAHIQNGTFFKAWYSNNTIQIHGKMEGPATIILYDIKGRVLMQKEVRNESQNSLSIPNFSNGIYLVKITGSNKTELLKVPVLK
jgi:hypothetical protein